MSINTENIQEDMLHAYVDHQLSDAQSAKVEEWLDAHPADAAKVQSWAIQNIALSRKFDKVHFQHVPEHLSPQHMKLRHNRAYFAQAAAVLLIVGSSLIGWFGHGWYEKEQLPIKQFVDSATMAYRVYSSEIKHPVEVGFSQKQHLQTWLSRRINHKLMIPELSDFGYKLVGGRLLSNTHSPAALLMYQQKSGARITLYAANSGTTRELSYQLTQKTDVNTYHWSTDGIDYALSGGNLEVSALKRVCDVVYDQMEDQHL